MADLTVIIASRNEGDHLRETLKSIRTTQDEDVNILVVNDDSTDGYDYDSLCKEFDSKIIHNETNIGAGPSKHKGTKHIETSNFILIDAHMRFRRDGWVSKVNKHISDNPKSVLCAGCGYLSETSLKEKFTTQELLDENIPKHGWRGASFNPTEGYKATWLPNKFWQNKEEGTHQIPSIMGASYACNLDWYNHVDGLNLLTSWGKEEPFLSWKSWRFGGDARVMLDVWIGHIWETRGSGISFDDGMVKGNIYTNALITLPSEFYEHALSQLKKTDPNGKGLLAIKDLMPDIEHMQSRILEADPDFENFKRLLACNRLITQKEVPWPSTVNKNIEASISPKKVKKSSDKLANVITVVIPFTDKEPEHLDNIIETAGTEIELILVNDGGSSSINKDISNRLGCTVLHNERSVGTSKCLQIAEAQSNGQILCYIPSNAKMLINNWALTMYNYIVKTPRSLTGFEVINGSDGLITSQRYFSRALDLHSFGSIVEGKVPSISDGGFFMTTRYFRRLSSLEFLKGGSCIGLNLSIKTWLEGGQVSSLKSIQCKRSSKNRESVITKLYDKLVTILTLFPREDMSNYLEPLSGVPGFEEAMGLIDLNSVSLEEGRERYERVFNRSFETISNVNDSLRGYYGKG